MQSIQSITLNNGLHLITEQVRDVRTAAIEWLVLGGVATNEHDGDSVLLRELMFRGAGGLSDREHTQRLDGLGVRRDISCGVRLLKLHALALGSKIQEAINPVFDMFLCPKLPEDGLVPSQQLCLQALDSLQDNPPGLVSIELNKHHFSSPFNRSTHGVASAFASATINRIRNVYNNTVCPAGSILSIAGDINHNAIQDAVSSKVDGWSGESRVSVVGSTPTRGIHHIEQDTSQVHIGLVMDAPEAGDPNSILERVAVSIFGGATSGRLFTEVRQKRSLCYSVHASYQPSKENSTVRVLAGTTPERATETVDVILDQLALLREGVTKVELARTITRLRAGTVMSGESTAARTRSLLGDQYALGTTRTLQGRIDELASVSLDEVNEYLKTRAFGAMTLVFLGSKALNIDESRVLQSC
jgi:predicted Zn-dependent peptidase